MGLSWTRYKVGRTSYTPDGGNIVFGFMIVRVKPNYFADQCETRTFKGEVTTVFSWTSVTPTIVLMSNMSTIGQHVEFVCESII